MAANYRHAYQFGAPEVVTLPNGKHLVKLKGKQFYDEAIIGAPLLPVKTARLFVPAGEEVVTVDVKQGRASVLEGRYDLQFATAPRPLSAVGPFPPDFPAPGIYDRDAYFPPGLSKKRSPQYLLGVQIVEVDLAPMQYNPVSGKLKYYDRVEVSITTRPVARPKDVVRYRGLQTDRIRILKTIDNKADFVAAEQAGTLTGEAAEAVPAEEAVEVLAAQYLVITTADLAPTFQTLTTYRASAAGGGYTTHIQDIAEIGVNYSGVDLAEKVRNYIRDMYYAGTRYVVLGGDVNLVPTRGCYAVVGSTIDNGIPSDLYYGCLDGSWNGDGDSLWGETNDGESGGDIDWYSEVYVGRISAENTSEAANHIGKIIAAEGGGPNHTLLIGEKLDDTPTWGGDRMDWVYSYMGGIGKTTLYDKTYSWSSGDLINLINSNQFHWLNHLGHSNNTYNMKMGTGSIGFMTNSDYFLLYSQGCYSGNLQANDCYGEVITKGYPDRGAHAYIGNSRYGWYNPGTYVQGASNWMHKEFAEAVFSDNLTRLGEANQVPKYGSHSGTYRWIAFETNLFGDPAFDLYPTGCASDAACDDGVYCNGAETCVGGFCQEGTPVSCSDDGIYCNGPEECIESIKTCGHTGNPCQSEELCNEIEHCYVSECSSDNECYQNDCTVSICMNPGTKDASCVHEPKICGVGGDSCCPEGCGDDVDPDCAICGDKRCRGAEDCYNCSPDCEFLSGEEGNPTNCFKGRPDGSCHPVKDGPDCPDCLPTVCCGDEICDPSTETPENCPADCGPDACVSDAQCDDEIFCNGDERCLDGDCVSGFGLPRCPVDQICDEAGDQCIDPPECRIDADCDDGLYCNGEETCDGGSCVSGSSPCLSGETCDEETDTCVAPPQCPDGICNGDENSCSCPADCGAPPMEELDLCSDGVDNDCDGEVDCDDPGCDTSAACSCAQTGDPCSSNSDCCSNRCHPIKGVCK